MGRRRCSKFIPDSDTDFAQMARTFANGIARNPARFKLSAGDAEEIGRAVADFRAAQCLALRKGTRTMFTLAGRAEARRKAEAIVRRYANVIRANPEIGALDKRAIGVRVRPTRLQKRACPMTRPLLSFVGSGYQRDATGGSRPVHLLRFVDQLGSGTRAKPPGAARLELFVELVPPGEPIPTHPCERSGGRAWYLRSFTKSPMKVHYPMPPTPMLVVYWGRWADATGAIGPWSPTAVARVEGWTWADSAPALEGAERAAEPQRLAAPVESAERLLDGPDHDRLLEGAPAAHATRRALRDGTTTTLVQLNFPAAVPAPVEA
jgi:hypothetical protein